MLLIIIFFGIIPIILNKSQEYYLCIGIYGCESFGAYTQFIFVGLLSLLLILIYTKYSLTKEFAFIFCMIPFTFYLISFSKSYFRLTPGYFEAHDWLNEIISGTNYGQINYQSISQLRAEYYHNNVRSNSLLGSIIDSFDQNDLNSNPVYSSRNCTANRFIYLRDGSKIAVATTGFHQQSYILAKISKLINKPVISIGTDIWCKF
jgi:hypothetical protein